MPRAASAATIVFNVLAEPGCAAAGRHSGAARAHPGGRSGGLRPPPVYCWAFPSQLKALLDRHYCLVKWQDGEVAAAFDGRQAGKAAELLVTYCRAGMPKTRRTPISDPDSEYDPYLRTIRVCCLDQIGVVFGIPATGDQQRPRHLPAIETRGDLAVLPFHQAVVAIQQRLELRGKSPAVHRHSISPPDRNSGCARAAPTTSSRSAQPGSASTLKQWSQPRRPATW